MATITTIQATDHPSDSRSVINTNFANLNADKLEASNNLSDVDTPNTALNNLLPDQTGNSGKILKTDGTNTTWENASGIADASISVKGVVEEATTAEIDADTAAGGTGARLAVNPSQLSTSKYGTRLPTADQKAALAGTGTPSAVNKFATADTVALKEDVSNKSTDTALGTSDTLYPSQKAVKTYVDGNPITYKNGVTTYDMATASGNQTIAHGLGRTPKKIRIVVTCTGYDKTGNRSDGVYNGTTNSVVYHSINNFTEYQDASSSYIVYIYSAVTGGYVTATATVDATNITLAWTKNGSPTGTAYIMWEAV